MVVIHCFLNLKQQSERTSSSRSVRETMSSSPSSRDVHHRRGTPPPGRETNGSSSNSRRVNGSRSWEHHSHEVPSYMTRTPPVSGELELNENNENNSSLQKKLKRRRPTVVKKKSSSDNASKAISTAAALVIAVICWYLLGVISIGSTKILLTRGIPPLYLTLQQLFLGSSLLHFLLQRKALGSSGMESWPIANSKSPVRRTQTQQQNPDSFWNWHLRDLLLSGIYFCLGFTFTNLSFSGASPAFVETVKASEPITSAATAVAWGIEVLSWQEGTALGTIVAGVVLSTLGNVQRGGGGATSLRESVKSCLVVILSNLCFSFRGLHQKLFRATTQGNKSNFDDLNLQYRMQQIGVGLLILPVLLWDTRSLLSLIFSSGRSPADGLRLLGLSVVNGFAFTSYNLASTFILTRISVVHHAALNCIRRIFAIIVTSIAFQIPITFIGAMGILVSFGGFAAFTHYKNKRQSQPKPISALLPMSAV